jgi:hypothetical protein
MCPLAVLGNEVDQRERHVLRMTGDRLRRNGARFLSRLRLGRPDAQVAQQSETALADDLVRDLVDGAEDAADAARLRLVR